ncbi:AEC family transporter [Candidatus Pantoea bituminis]|uniref:AEC family transporter n=1 Tax=Candidatus Pantoea bituminis TaxID=2831036 RepID=UPI001C06150D|nr:AEC family transporter [Pantoea bituminis]
MTAPVVNALLPVVILILIGFAAVRRGWLKSSAIMDISNLAFLILGPALFFRSMAQVHLNELDFKPVIVYFLTIWVVFFATMFTQGINRRGAIMALSATFSNVAMIGVPLINFTWGQEGLIVLFTLMSVHTLIMLTMVTSLIEFSISRELAAGNTTLRTGRLRSFFRTFGVSMRKTLLHPVPLPVICGILFGLTGLKIPTPVDNVLVLLGHAFSPVALILVGMTLATSKSISRWRVPLMMALAKNCLHPAALLIMGLLTNLSGLSLKVMMITAALPIGANVYLFAHRYKVAQEEVTAAVAISAVLGLITLPAVMLLLSFIG